MISSGKKSRKVTVQADHSGHYRGAAVVGRGLSFLVLTGLNGSTDWNYAMGIWSGTGNGPLRLPTLEEAELMAEFSEQLLVELRKIDKYAPDPMKYPHWTSTEKSSTTAWSMGVDGAAKETIKTRTEGIFLVVDY